MFWMLWGLITADVGHAHRGFGRALITTDQMLASSAYAPPTDEALEPALADVAGAIEALRPRIEVCGGALAVSSEYDARYGAWLVRYRDALAALRADLARLRAQPETERTTETTRARRALVRALINDAHRDLKRLARGLAEAA